MSRPLRMEFPQAVYHVMNRGAGRREVFLGKEDNENFLETLAETHALWGVEVFAYCLFRGRYKGIVVDGDEYLAVVVHYIHLNPVEAGLVREPQAHRWSSRGAYLSRSKAPVWLNVREVLERFKDRREFHDFVLSGNEDRIREYYSSQRQSPLLGGEGFLEWVRARREKFSGEYPRYERVGVRPAVETVVWATLNGHEARNGGYSQGLA